MIRPALSCAALIGLLIVVAGAPAADPLPPSARPAGGADDSGGAGKTKEKKEKALTLERLFPDKAIFGTSASGMAFSADGRYAAYLFRPYIERRHGNDLWIYEVATGETRRVTSASVMAAFHESARKVRDDRIEKAKKRREQQRRSGSSAAAAPPADDGLTGDWEGRMRGPESVGLPPDGLTARLALRVRDGSVSGTLSTLLASVQVTGGTWDKATGRLECTLGDSESGMRGTLEATVTDGVLEGRIEVEGMEAAIEIRAERVAGDGEQGASQEGDREEQEKEKEKEKKEEGDEEDFTGDEVDDKDADDDKSPRYGGIASFSWAPDGAEMILVSEGDLFRWSPGADGMTRLTRTQDYERDVQYLPDGSGYTFRQGNALMKVSFGSHLQEQLDPRLPSGETMNGYRISPDGKRLVFVTTKGPSVWQGGRMVSIASYRGRFMEVNQVPRQVSDDAIPDTETSVWVYVPDDVMAEKGELKKVFTTKTTGPRDVMRVPAWAPDSSRVVFAVFRQKPGDMRIMQSVIREPEPEPEPESESDDEDDEDDDDEDDEERENDKGDDEPVVEISDAAVVYRLYHHGGPTTPRMVEVEYLPDSRRIVFLSELSGFRHLHLLDPLYETVDAVTRGRFELYPIGISEDHSAYHVLATREHPSQQHIYRVDLETAEMTALTATPGYWGDSAAVSDDGSHVLASYVTFGAPGRLVAVDVASGAEKDLTDSHPDEAKELSAFKPEYFTYANRHGHEIHGHMFKPDGWTADDRRPLLIYVYGGPLGSRKMVTDGSYAADSYFFAYYMAKVHGFVTCTIDPRGVSGYGGFFEKANFEQVGRPQVEDLVDGAKWFAEHQGVDSGRIALHGWSFGGFQTQMCLYTEPDVFAAGMAGAGPTEWENYNAWYTQGTIGETRAGHPDLGKFSLLPLAKNLKAKLLLVHGMEDSNVLYQDTVRVYRELLKSGKETLVELFLDPTGGHGLGGDVKRLGRYRKYEEFLLRTVGPYAPPEADPAEGEGEG